MTALSPNETRLIGFIFSSLDEDARRRALQGTWFEINLDPHEFAQQLTSTHPEAAREVYRRLMRETQIAS